MTPPKAALVAATDQMLAAVQDVTRSGDPEVQAAASRVEAYAAEVLAEFPGHEEVAGRVLLVAAAIVDVLAAGEIPEATRRGLTYMLGLIGERVHREGGDRA